MNLPALQHLLRSAQALAEDCQFLVFGSASLLVSFPELGIPPQPLTATYDADLCPQPFDELTGTMLEEALGEHQAYSRRHGYHADILRDSIFQTLPQDWRQRLVPIPGCTGAAALEPHDLAAVKIFVARPKDIALVNYLHTSKLIEPSVVKDRLDSIAKPDADSIRCAKNFRLTFPA